MQKIPPWINELLPKLLWAGTFIIITLAHTTYIPNDFTWLDHGDIKHGRAILPLNEIHQAFFTPFGQTGFYRPLVTIIHSLDTTIYGQWAPGYRLTNVLLHTLVAGTFALFLTQFFTQNLYERIAATLIAGIHPLSWLPTGAISYRPELLAALFVFLTLYFHAKTRVSASPKNIALTTICVGLAFLSKESTLVWIPGLILIWEFCTPHKKNRSIIFIFELSILIAYAICRWLAVPELWQASSITLPLSQALGTRLSTLGLLLCSLALPTLPHLSDATPIQSFTHISALLTAMTILILAVLVIKVGRQSPWTSILLFIAIALSPALNILPLPRFYSPHYAYLASFGFGMAIALILRLSQNTSLKIPTRLFIVFWAIISLTTTAVSGSRFSNDHTLFGFEVIKDPNFREGHYYLALSHKNRGDLTNAQRSYIAALIDNPDVIAYVDAPSAAVNLAEIHLANKRPDKAEVLLSQAVKQAPPYLLSTITYNRALIASQQGQHDRVVSLLTENTYQWKRPEPLLLLARALGNLGRTAQAATALRQSFPLLNSDQKQKVDILLKRLEQ